MCDKCIKKIGEAKRYIFQNKSKSAAFSDRYADNIKKLVSAFLQKKRDIKMEKH